MPSIPKASRLGVEHLEARDVPTALPTVPDFAAFGAPANRPPVYLLAARASDGGQVRVFDFASGTERFRITPFGTGYTGGVRVATGDVNADGTPDVVCATTAGVRAAVRVYDGKTGQLIAAVRPFGDGFTGGLSVATADFNHDGKADVVVGAGDGLKPIVKIYDGASSSLLGRFMAFSENVRTGVRVAAGDVNGDGTPDVIACTATGQAVVTGYDGHTIDKVKPQKLFARFYATGRSATGGGWVGVADVNGDGYADVAVGLGNGTPQAKIFSGQSLPLGGIPGLLATIPFDLASAQSGVRVAFADLNGDGKAELVMAANTGSQPAVGVYNPRTGTRLDAFNAFEPGFVGGVDVG